MKHVRKLLAGVATTGLALAPAVALADRDADFNAKLEGIQETPSVITRASGRFKAEVDERAGAIHWELSYRDLQGAVTQAHIHIGQRHTAGGIVVFLCSNLKPPAGVPVPQPCPPPPAQLSGIATAANVLATPPTPPQGVEAGEISAVIQALKKGAAYVNVHSDLFPAGEIRAQIQGDHH